MWSCARVDTHAGYTTRSAWRAAFAPPRLSRRVLVLPTERAIHCLMTERAVRALHQFSRLVCVVAQREGKR